jgi:uncharacterized protein (TIGR02284 family)
MAICFDFKTNSGGKNMINDYEATKPMTEDAVLVETAINPNDAVIDKLNDLIQVCKDGEAGFKDAAEGVEHDDLKTLFMSFSQQRGEFTGILQELVRSLGGDPEKEGTFSAALRRGWMDIKLAVVSNDELAILNECERSEDHAKAAYAEALTAGLPANIADIVAQQSHALVATHNRIKELRNDESHMVAAPGA